MTLGKALTEGFCGSKSKLLMAQGSAKSSTGSLPEKSPTGMLLLAQKSYYHLRNTGSTLGWVPRLKIWRKHSLSFLSYQFHKQSSYKGSIILILDRQLLPSSTTARIPSSEQIMTGNIREPTLEGFILRSYWISQISLSETKLVTPSPIPTPDKIIGCCCRRRSQANMVPDDPPAYKYRR